MLQHWTNKNIFKEVLTWHTSVESICMIWSTSTNNSCIHYSQRHTIIYHCNTRHITLLNCRQRAPFGIDLSSSGTSQLGMFDIQATTKCKYYDHIVLLYLESRRCRYRSIIFACFYLYTVVVIFIDYSDIDKMMDINNEKC